MWGEDRVGRLTEIVQAAGAMEPAKRGAFLDQACASDPALRIEAERLLAHRSAADLASPRRTTIDCSPEIDTRYPKIGTPSAQVPAVQFADTVEDGGPPLLAQSPWNIEPSFPFAEQQIGSYTLLQKIGEGGLGVVYLAEQRSPIQRRVALKLIKPGLDSREVITRFNLEYHALALMDHSNIARVYDAGTTSSGAPYFIMEYVPGVPLTTFCDQNRLTIDRRLALFMDTCHGIQHAHHKGIIHRDLKPSNILVMLQDDKPVPKIIDFGVAKAVGGTPLRESPFTEIGQLIGTLEYMSPEQAVPTPIDIDTRVDIYSLGVVLYQLLTGTLPFESEVLRKKSLSEIQRIISEDDPARPSDRIAAAGASDAARRRSAEHDYLVKELREDLDWITMKALEKDRTRRYATASELAGDIARHLADEPVVAGPPSTVYRIKKFMSRHRKPVIAGLAVVWALVAGLLASTLLYFRAERQRERAVVAEEAADVKAVEAGRERDAAQSARLEADKAREAEAKSAEVARLHLETANRVLFDLFLQNGQYAFDQGAFQKSAVFFAKALELKEDPTARGKLHAARRKGPGAPKWVSPRGIGKIEALGFRADGELVASGSSDGRVRLWHWASGNLILELEGHRETVSSVAFHPLRNVVASASPDRTVRLWDSASGESLARKELVAEPFSIAFSPDGSQLGIGDQEGVIRLLDNGSLDESNNMKAHRNPIRCLAFSADGTQLASASDDSWIRLWNARTLERIGSEMKHDLQAKSVVFSPDGRFLASGSNDRTVRVWDSTTGRELLKLEGHQSFVRCVAFNASGNHVASASMDKTVRIWDARSGETVAVLEGHTDYVRALAFHPGGDLLTGGWDETLRVWNGTGKCTATLDGHNGAVHSISFFPDMRLVSASQDETVRIWDTESGESSILVDNRAGRRPLGINDNPLTGKEYLSPHEPREPVYCLAVTHDAGLLGFGCKDRSVRLWNLAAHKELWRSTEHTDSVRCVAFAPVGDWIASGGHDKTIRLWSRSDGRAGPVLAGHTGAVRSIAFAPDARHLASASEDRGVRIWDLEHLREKHTLPHAGPVLAVAFSPKGDGVASGGSDGTIRLWNPETGSEISRPAAHHEKAVTAVAFSPNGSWLISGSDDRTVRLWKTGNLEDVTMVTLFEGHTSAVRSVAFDAEGTTIAASAENGAILIWRLKKDPGVVAAPINYHGREIAAVNFSKSGRLVASGGWGFRVCSMGNPAPVTDSDSFREDVRTVAFHPDESKLATGSDDKLVRLWDISKTKAAELRRMSGHNSKINAVAFSVTGKHLLSGSEDRTLHVWGTDGGEPSAATRKLKKPIYAVAVSPDGESLAVGDSIGTVFLWRRLPGADADSWPFWEDAREIVVRIEAHTAPVRGLAFSPDSAWLASASSDSSVRIWDVRTQARLAKLEGHLEVVNSVAFGMNASLIASGSMDHTIRIWSSVGWTEQARVEWSNCEVSAVAFSPIKNVVVTGSFGDWTARMWDVDLLLDPREGILARVETETGLVLAGLDVRPASTNHLTPKAVQ